MSLAESLEKELGTSDTKQEVTQWIDTGFPNLNKIISGRHQGGLGFGRLYEIYGPSSSGKSLLATNVMVNAQKMGGFAIFIDYERSFDVGMAVKAGLSTNPSQWFYKAPETWEQGNDIAMKAVKLIRENKSFDKDKPIIVVQDSIAEAVPQASLEKELSDYSMNDSTALSRATSIALKKVASIANKYDATFLYLNQIRQKPGISYGPSTSTPGGMAMEFSASGRVELTRSKVMEKIDGDDILAAQIIKAKAVKSKHTRPFSTTEFRVAFREDGSPYFDEATNLIDYLIDLGIIEQLGAYVTFQGKKWHKKPLVKFIEEEGKMQELRDLIPRD